MLSVGLKNKSMHIIIAVMFIFYLVSANYIFNNLLKLKNESVLINIDSEIVECQLKYSIDSIYQSKLRWKNTICIRGWALKKDEDVNNCEILLKLDSNNNKYVFSTFKNMKPGLTKVIGEEVGMNLDESGFQANIPYDVMKDGAYKLGILIRSGDINYYSDTNNYITIIKNKIYLSYISQSNRNIANEINKVDNDIDTFYSNAKTYIDSMSNENIEVLEIKGWGFIEGIDSKNSEIYVVIKSNNNIYVYDTQNIVRKDVTDYFKDMQLNLDNSGFNANILAKGIESGKYQIGIYIENGDKKALVYTDKYYEK